MVISPPLHSCMRGHQYGEEKSNIYFENILFLARSEHNLHESEKGDSGKMRFEEKPQYSSLGTPEVSSAYDKL